MRKENVELILDLFDTVFNDINASNKNKGTGLSFSYKFEIIPEDKAPSNKVEYKLGIVLREMGHGERTLQEFIYHKPEGHDLHTMKYLVLSSVVTVMFESTMLQWNEIGKMLNTDETLRESITKL